MRTEDTTVPTLSVPLRLNPGGTHVEVEESGSPEAVRGWAYNVLVTPLGHRDELPEFGVADPTFRLVHASLEDIETAVEQWIGEDVTLDEDPDYLEDLVRRVRVMVGE